MDGGLREPTEIVQPSAHSNPPVYIRRHYIGERYTMPKACLTPGGHWLGRFPRHRGSVMAGHRVRTGAAVGALLSVLISATPGLAAFGPTVVVDQGAATEDLTLTDLAARGSRRALVTERLVAGIRYSVLSWSTNSGSTWSHEAVEGTATSEPEVTICGGTATAVHRVGTGATALVRSLTVPFGGGLNMVHDWTPEGSVRKPDIACIANAHVAVAWFERVDGVWRVRVRTQAGSPQTFGLGKGTVSRGLSIVASQDRLLVAWFRGKDLKVRRFRIGSGSQHTLTSLGTTTVASLQYGRYPEIGADGARVFLAYMDRADLKVRRSTNRGASFGGATTLRNEPFPSEIGAYPITVAVKGKRVVVGGIEIGGIEELVGRGLGYMSTNAGSSWTLKASHSSGGIAAALVKVGTRYQYAEAWDQSISDPVTERIRYRRDCTGPGCVL